MPINMKKTPWPWFGGKADAAPIVWQALGDVPHYVEPFAGSLAVLMRRPHPCNRPYVSETVNDADGLLVNAWRSMQFSPDAMADAASWPVTEADMHARHLALLRWRKENELGRLMADPHWHDPVMAGWWAWGQSCWIGSGWCSGKGAWIVGADGRITKQGDKGGISLARPQLMNNGTGVSHPSTRMEGVGSQDFHPMTMPELRLWFHFLAARLRHVRVLNGDWSRAVASGVAESLSVRMGDGPCGIFLDPPYSSDAERASDLYSVDSLSVANEVRDWALKHGESKKHRIIVAGFDGEHKELVDAGWTEVEWFRAGFLRGGMGHTGKTNEHQQARERLWLSPHCLRQATQSQQSMFG